MEILLRISKSRYLHVDVVEFHPSADTTTGIVAISKIETSEYNFVKHNFVDTDGTRASSDVCAVLYADGSIRLQYIRHHRKGVRFVDIAPQDIVKDDFFHEQYVVGHLRFPRNEDRDINVLVSEATERLLEIEQYAMQIASHDNPDVRRQFPAVLLAISKLRAAKAE